MACSLYHLGEERPPTPIAPNCTKHCYTRIAYHPLTDLRRVFTVFTMSEQRETILARACDLYLAEGLDGFSMRKLAKLVGVTGALSALAGSTC